MPVHPAQTRIRLVLVHEHVLFRESLARLLTSEPDFELAAECSTPNEALEELSDSGGDVVLLDLNAMQGDSSFIRAAREAGYTGRFLVVTSTLDAARSAEALRLGASGVFLESGSSARFIQAIRMVANGEAWVDQKVLQLLADRYPQPYQNGVRSPGLTDRQRIVLQGVVDGMTNRTIGDRMGVSEGTIKATLQQLFSRAGVRTRSQLVRAVLDGSLSADLHCPVG